MGNEGRQGNHAWLRVMNTTASSFGSRYRMRHDPKDRLIPSAARADPAVESFAKRSSVYEISLAASTCLLQTYRFTAWMYFLDTSSFKTWPTLLS